MCNYNTELLDFVWPGLFVHCRAGAPGCGRTHTSSGPRTAPPRGCPGWSAAGPASLASHARAPAARRSTPSLKHQTGQWKSLRSLLACWRISAKVFPWHRNVQKIAAAATSWFQPDLSNKGTFRAYLFRGCNWRSPPGRRCNRGCLTESLQFAWVEVVEEVEEASLHLSHIRDVSEEGVLQGGWLHDFTGPCRLRGPGLLLVRPE